MRYTAKNLYPNELLFTQELSDFLDGTTINNSTVTSTHQQLHVNNTGGIPDITLTLDAPVSMKWRQLSQPFFVECKMSSVGILHDIEQLWNYKYLTPRPNKLRPFGKYGDFHVVATCPEFLMDGFNPRDYGKEHNWLSPFALIRFLWTSGLGVLYKHKDGHLRMSFNEQEELDIKKYSKLEEFL